MIELKHLELIYAIDRQGSMTKAAEQLHLTQPALSHQLKALEEELSATVFERRGRQLQLTTIGKRLLKTAGRVREEMDRAAKDIESLISGKVGVLRFTTECYSCYHWIPGVLQNYNNTFPKVDVQIVAEAAKNPPQKLQNDEIDVAITTNIKPFDESYEVVPLLKDEYVSVVAQNHPWAQKSFVEPRDFETEHLISVKEFLEGNPIYNDLFLLEGIIPKKVTVIPIATEAIIEMVNAGMGVALMASWAVNSYQKRFPGLRKCRLTKQGVFRPWYIVYPKHKTALFIREFANFVKAVF